jgi:DNA-binding ferritin-like protein
MFKCEWCGKEVKSPSGLTRHMNNCSQKPVESQEDVEVANDISEVVEVYTDSSRAIEKLLDLRKSTFDAETRKVIEAKIRDISGKEWYNFK